MIIFFFFFFFLCVCICAYVQRYKKTFWYRGSPKGAEGTGTKLAIAQLVEHGVVVSAVVKDKDCSSMNIFRDRYPDAKEQLDPNHVAKAYRDRIQAQAKAGCTGTCNPFFFQLFLCDFLKR